MEVSPEKVNQVLDRILKDRGFVYPSHQMLAERDPEFMELFHSSFMHVFHHRKALPLKFKEILGLCLDAMFDFKEAFRVHTRNALAAGATEDEILEALELTTLIGMRPITSNLSLLVEEVTAYKQKHQADKRP
jgi:alkylhydroperoxidase/carboxymuconolactone decarboxylase family protein YurZ